jgi:hypothetical protein
VGKISYSSHGASHKRWTAALNFRFEREKISKFFTKTKMSNFPEMEYKPVAQPVEVPEDANSLGLLQAVYRSNAVSLSLYLQRSWQTDTVGMRVTMQPCYLKRIIAKIAAPYAN